MTTVKHEEAGEVRTQPFLCVDLDGTLIRSDIILEQLLLLVKLRPHLLLRLPLWLLRGKAHLKERLSANTELDVSLLPYRDSLLRYLEEERVLGRQLVLATAAHRNIAQKVADHLGIFSKVLATHGTLNLSGTRKADALVAACGEQGFVYAGDAPVDRAVWKQAQGAIVVGRRQGLVRELSNLEQTFPESGRPKELLRAVRLHQWVKNLLVFIPLLLTHQISSLPQLTSAALAFLAFCFCASSVYVQNDLLDIEADRHHPRKRFRPFASGKLSIRFGLLLAPALLLAALATSLGLPPTFLAVLGVYFVATLAYSLYLKQKPIIDVLTLALLYVMRIIAGGVAIGVALSPWLLAFAMFFFLSLAYVKRYSEIRDLEQGGSLRARGYVHSDLEGLADLGVSSGYVSALVVALYINSSVVTQYYRSPALLWLICPLIVYWLSRMWLLARRGKMHDDPIVFALSDRISYIVGALVAIVATLASWGVGNL